EALSIHARDRSARPYGVSVVTMKVLALVVHTPEWIEEGKCREILVEEEIMS
ncbi:MAG: hypothetical protein QOD94_1090, partial [Alphaproteobacteria bacterium]|nr:hypothetical protein [Alphaproteobacteria bacterium]